MKYVLCKEAFVTKSALSFAEKLNEIVSEKRDILLFVKYWLE